jgi:PLP dependent protein
MVPMGHNSELVRRFEETKQAVAELAAKHGRKPEEVRIIAVSKLHPAVSLAVLAENGHRDFGENYIQEALHKKSELAHLDLKWHFLGRLQRNKAKFVPGTFCMLHSLDNIDLAWDLHQRCLKKHVVLDVLIQVNQGRELQKGGVLQGEIWKLADSVCQMPGLMLRGLMTLPPFESSQVEKRMAFAALRMLRDDLQIELGFPLPELSMGTTDDFPQAIAEGATMVRIGTAIFGARTAQAP